MYAWTVPAPNVLSPFLAEISPLFLRRMTSAFSRSPPASSRAFLHCMTEIPVSSRSALTCSAVIVDAIVFVDEDLGEGDGTGEALGCALLSIGWAAGFFRARSMNGLIISLCDLLAPFVCLGDL